jgi:hypothetical protein
MGLVDWVLTLVARVILTIFFVVGGTTLAALKTPKVVALFWIDQGCTVWHLILELWDDVNRNYR